MYQGMWSLSWSLSYDYAHIVTKQFNWNKMKVFIVIFILKMVSGEIPEDIDVVLSVRELMDMVGQDYQESREARNSGEDMLGQKSREGRNSGEFLVDNALREPRQLSVIGQDEDQVTFEDVAELDENEERRCIEKVILEQETEWEEEITCHHRYRTHCFTTFSTAFNPIQEKECRDHYIKNCFIEYGVAAVNDTVRVCRRPMVKDCSVEGDEICSTEYETECWTRQVRQEIDDDFPDCKSIVEQVCSDQVSGYTTSQKCSDITRLVCEVKHRKSLKYKPSTECKKMPVEICAPAGCGFVEGPEQCHDKTGLVIFDKPEESCDLAPFKKCDFVTKLVPYLKETGKCIDVPLEVCVRQQRNPRKVDKPIIKIWCYKVTKDLLIN